MAEKGQARFHEEFIQNLASFDKEKRHRAFEELIQKGNRARSFLLEILPETRNWLERYQVASLLVALDGEEVSERCLELLSHERAGVRAWAAAILGATGDTAAAPRIRTLLGENDDWVSLCARYVLHKLGLEEIPRELSSTVLEAMREPTDLESLEALADLSPSGGGGSVFHGDCDKVLNLVAEPMNAPHGDGRKGFPAELRFLFRLVSEVRKITF
jgi:hypothetical protein